MIEIRYATLHDLEIIVEFNSAMARETEYIELKSETIRAGVRNLLTNKVLGFYLIADVNDKSVGQVLITTEWSDWSNGYFWWIQSVYVNPDYRRKNVYRRLHEKVTKLALNQGNVRGLRLYVDSDNSRAQKVYKLMGMNQSSYVFFEDEWNE
ncbi:MAG: GNAT family N-acetyltransferase [Candidatus Neomarinimicrobiota bacterium]